MRSLRFQLLLSHLVLVLLMGLVTSATITGIYSLRHMLGEVVDEDVQGLLASQRMQEAIQEQQTAVSLLLLGDRAGGTTLLDRSWNAFVDAYKTGASHANGDVERRAYVAADEIGRRYQSRLEQVLGEPAYPADRARTLQTLGRLQSDLRDLTGEVRTIGEDNQNAILRANERARAASQDTSTRSIWLTAVALVVAVLLALRLVRIALNPLKRLADQAELIGGGDLTRRLEFRRNDEIGHLADSFNQMAENLLEARRKEERRLQRAERMSDAALESLYDPVIVTDAKSRIVHLNRAAQGLFGPTPPGVRTPVAEHIADRRVLRAIESTNEDRAVPDADDEGVFVPVKVRGAERTYRLRATPMRGDDGTRLGSVAVLEDITHLRELDRLKTEFIGVASHELRTPVTSLLLSNGLLAEGAAGDLSPLQKEIIESQAQDLNRLERLMRELLDITRLEAGSSPPRFEIVPAQELLRSAMVGLKPQAENKGVELSVEEPRPDLLVRADRSQIGRVLTNLIANGVRHTPGGGRVSVRAIAAADAVTFEVEDSGEGIPKEFLDRIFERFVQVPGATQGGAGLGLPIAQTIVEAHGGKMTVDSAVGKGSTFRFTLPRESKPSAEVDKD